MKSKKHADADVIERLGGTAAVARACGIKPPSVSGWKMRGIPKGWRELFKLKYPEVFGETNSASPAPKSGGLPPRAAAGIGGVSVPANTPEAMARALAARGITVQPEAQPPASASVSPEECDPDAGRIVPFEELP